jgi:Flp pilus assembly protein TadD, contains TPR repeats
MKKHKISTLLILVLTATLLAGCGSKSAGQLYKDGLNYLEDGDYQKAEEVLSQAVVKNPDKAEYYIAYGMSLVKTKQYKEAQIQFKKAIIDKENQVVKENNKKAYRGMGIGYYEASEFGLAVKAFDQALNIDTLDQINADILSYKADSQGKDGKYEDAAKTYTELLKVSKKDADIYAKRAQMEGNSGDSKSAIADYDKAISLDKKNYDYYFGKYAVLKSIPDKNAAEQVLEQALTIKSKTNEDFYQVAKVYFYLGDDTNAKTELLKAVKNNITDAYFYLGVMEQRKGDYDKAVDYYQNYIKSESGKKSSEAYNELGICLMKKGNYKKALSSFQSGVALNDSFWMKKLCYNEIAALEHVADYKEALNRAKQYLKAYPKDKEMQREYEFIQTRVGKR